MMSAASAASEGLRLMAEPQGERGTRYRRRIAIVCAVGVMTIGCVVILGWIAHLPALIQVQPEWSSMKFNTALCFVAIGAGALSIVFRERRGGLACGSFVAAIGSLTLIQYAFHVDLFIDQAFLTPFHVEPQVPPGRMSPITAGLFVLAGSGLILLAAALTAARASIVALSASMIAGVALSALIGYATKTPAAYAWGAIPSVAVHTAAAFLLVAGALGACASGLDEEYLPQWLPWAALVTGLACTLTLGTALFYELQYKPRSLIPELTMAVGAMFSVLLTVLLQSRRRLAVQRDLIRRVLSRREDALLASERAEQLVRGILEAAPDAMIVSSAEGLIELVNSMAERLFGYERAELIGQPVECLVPESSRSRHESLRQEFSKAPSARAMGAGRELMGLRKDGSHIPIDVALNALRTSDRTLVISVIRDVTQQRISERRLRDSLDEKELLLKEVHHRVKNNLQVVASMLALQSERAADAQAREMLENCRQRVTSMSLVHEKLYGARDLRQIDLGDLVHDIAAMLISSGPRTHVETIFDIEHVIVDIEIAFPASLIVNELITNAIKHAFVGRSHGCLRISVQRTAPKQVRITVSDDGAGGVTVETFSRGSTLGATIVRRLVKQLDGELCVDPGPGLSISISFPFQRSRHERSERTDR